MSTHKFELATVQFSRLTRRGIMLGLSLPQLVILGVGLAVAVIALYTVGGTGLVVTSPIWSMCAFVATVPIGGRQATEWVPIVGRWLQRRAAGQTEYRRTLMSARPEGTLALPGDAASLREWVDEETGAAMIHDPHQHLLTAILAVNHPAFVLLDPGDQQRRVEGWGRVLASACRSGRIARVQVSERTMPDSGTGLAQWWKDHGHADGSWAATTYAELIERAGPTGERHATTVSLSLDLRAAARAIRTSGGGIRGAARVLRQEMATFTTAMRSADLTVDGWLTPGDVALVLRAAYDPATAAALERHGDVGRELATAGPVAVTEKWDQMRSDSAFHTVLWISEWPRSQVYPGFLAPLVLSTGILRTISLHYMPVRADQAARDIRRKRTELISDKAQRQKLGQIEDAATAAEYGDVVQQEADLSAGHGLVRVVGLLSITAPSADELESAVAAVEQMAIQSSCETRRLVGQQARAFAACALPLARPV